MPKEWAVEAPANDPLMIIPALAAITENLAFGVTVTTSYEHPFTHARRFSTLDHMTNGRIGWNIVTSYLSSAARNFGLEQMIKHDDRYERAEEFMDVAYKLWGRKPATMPWLPTRHANCMPGVIACARSTMPANTIG